MPRRSASVELAVEQTEQLERWIPAGGTPQQVVLRAKIVRQASEGSSDKQIAADLSVHPRTVALWRQRVHGEGIEGIIERYRRRETSVEEALLEMYYAGVSMRRVEDITEALWGTRVSPSTVSELNQNVAGQIRHIAGKTWGAKRYMDMSRLRDLPAATADEPQTA